MKRISTTNKVVDLFGAGKHGWRDGDLGTGVQPTYGEAAWFNNLQEEVASVIEGAGIALDGNVRTQLYQAIQLMITGAANNDFKASVRAATTANIANLAGGAPGTLDGVALVVADRIMVKDQATASQNGLYVVTTLGTGANGTWTRSTDADGAGELTSGAVVAVEEGTTNADSQWMLTTDGVITIGTTSLTFIRKDSSIGCVQGAFKNLQASATGLNANVTVTADEISVENSSNQYQTLRSVSLTIAGTSVGANALDAGTIAASTWYSIWVIWNGTITAGLMSLSATAPTLPSGYTHKARVGWIRTDGTANKYPLSFIQSGRSVQFKVAAGSNLPSLTQLAVGVAGTYGTTLVSVSISSVAPVTAAAIHLLAYQAGGQTIQISPNSVATIPGANGVGISNSGADNVQIMRLLLESTSVYWASNGAANKFYGYGWEDNL